MPQRVFGVFKGALKGGFRKGETKNLVLKTGSPKAVLKAPKKAPPDLSWGGKRWAPGPPGISEVGPGRKHGENPGKAGKKGPREE